MVARFDPAHIPLSGPVLTFETRLGERPLPARSSIGVVSAPRARLGRRKRADAASRRCATAHRSDGDLGLLLAFLFAGRLPSRRITPRQQTRRSRMARVQLALWELDKLGRGTSAVSAVLKGHRRDLGKKPRGGAAFYRDHRQPTSIPLYDSMDLLGRDVVRDSSATHRSARRRSKRRHKGMKRDSRHRLAAGKGTRMKSACRRCCTTLRPPDALVRAAIAAPGI